MRARLLLLGAALVLGIPSGARAQDVDEASCGGWTQWVMPPGRAVPLMMSFRICPLPNERLQVEWRWANTSDRDLTFQYRLYSSNPGGCDARTGKSFAAGKHHIKGGHVDHARL